MKLVARSRRNPLQVESLPTPRHCAATGGLEGRSFADDALELLGHKSTQRTSLFRRDCTRCPDERSVECERERDAGLHGCLKSTAAPGLSCRHAPSFSWIRCISASASLGPRPGLVIRSAAIWLSAAIVMPFFIDVRPNTTSSNGVRSATFPKSVVCLTSALQFHGIGTQLPAEVWLAVPRGTRVPRLSAPPVRVVRVAPEVFDLGAEEHRVEGQTVRVYGVARTIADCFRFRNKVGLDVVLEALADAWRAKRLNLDELHRLATGLRVQRVMQPYLEAIVL